MKTTKRDVQAAIGELNARIPLAVAMQQEVERVAALLQAEKAAIRELLDEAGATAWPCADGCSAVLVFEERLAWNVDKLEALLKRDDFNELCPRKPDGAKLRKVLDTTPDAAELKRCARVSHTQRLELRAPAETKVTEKAA
jgi:hypothetical protein